MSPRFVADCMVGRLAKWLRALGFDVVYRPFADDRQVVAWAKERGAVLLTRDTRLASANGGASARSRQSPGVRVIFLKDDHVEDQLQQVVEETPLDLTQARPLTRCIACNGDLAPATRDQVWRRVPPFIYLTQERYARCDDCGRVYWEGTHAARMGERLAELARRVGWENRGGRAGL